jgi:hypothetical protein
MLPHDRYGADGSRVGNGCWGGAIGPLYTKNTCWFGGLFTWGVATLVLGTVISALKQTGYFEKHGNGTSNATMEGVYFDGVIATGLGDEFGPSTKYHYL